MQSNGLKKIKLLIVLVVIAAGAWFFVIQPQIVFRTNEKTMEAAAKRYFDLNSSQLPTGERVKTIELQKLYDNGLIKEDFYIPLTKKTCSNTNSWAKVRREDGVFKYYIYLECGRYKSHVDHTGPTIKIYGDEDMTLGRGETYKELGVKSVVDNTDGKMNKKDVIVKGTVNSKRAGTYKVKYIAFDSLSNRTEVVRTVKVIRKISSEMKDLLETDENFKGDPDVNYIMLSNMLFRVYKVDENNNIVVIADEDLGNVNYSKLDKWLDYFYNMLNKKTQKMIIEQKYCNNTIADIKDKQNIKCTSYTEKRKMYIPSAVDALAGSDNMGYNYMKADTISWVANAKNKEEAYVTRSRFFPPYQGEDFLSYKVDEVYGVRPMFTIDGNLLIKGGDGSIGNPYNLGDSKKGKGGTPLNERNTGEYIMIGDILFRIIQTEEDGTTKVISNSGIGDITIENCPNSDKVEYNPKNKYSVAYRTLNEVTKYLDTSLFVKHEVEVPVYKGEIIYGEEIKTKKYNLLLAAPDAFELFSSQPSNIDDEPTYWFRNESQKTRRVLAMMPAGVPTNYEVSNYERYGLRVVGYIKKSAVVISGDGSVFEPYIIK